MLKIKIFMHTNICSSKMKNNQVDRDHLDLFMICMRWNKWFKRTGRENAPGDNKTDFFFCDVLKYPLRTLS